MHVTLKYRRGEFTMSLLVLCFRLASNYQSFLAVLGIKNPVHKQKLSIKATDVVLFGPPKSQYYYLYVALYHHYYH